MPVLVRDIFDEPDADSPRENFCEGWQVECAGELHLDVVAVRVGGRYRRRIVGVDPTRCYENYRCHQCDYRGSEACPVDRDHQAPPPIIPAIVLDASLDLQTPFATGAAQLLTRLRKGSATANACPLDLAPGCFPMRS